MKFAIRDDDTNYFTKPADLERAYKGIWNICQVSLAVVPFHASTKSGSIPSKYWRDNKTFPIGNNRPLVAFLKKKIREKKVSIMLHGYSHKNYSGGPEFVAGDNLYEKAKEGKAYLEKLFGVKIKTFVPPHNRLSEEGRQAVARAGMNIASHEPFYPWIRPLNYSLMVKKSFYFIKTAQFLNYSSRFYPFILDFKDHKELQCSPLVPSTSLEQLKRHFLLALNTNGVFCLNTHYWELDKKLKKKLDDFLRWTKTYSPRYVPTDQLFR